MEERILNRENDRPLEFTVRKTSGDRFWAGFDARLYDVSGGVTETPSFPKHNVTMLVSAPLRTSCCCDGFISRRFQLTGEIDVVPAGYSGAWEDGGPATFLDVNLSSSLLQSAAEAMGLNPDRVSVVPKLQLCDPQIEHVCWALANDTEDVKVRAYNDDCAIVTAILHQRYEYRGKMNDYRVRFTDTWVKIDGSWRYVAGHASMLAAR